MEPNQPKIFPEGSVGSPWWAAAPALPVNNFCLNFCGVGAGGISQIGVCLAEVWGLGLTDRHRAAALTAVKYDWLSCGYLKSCSKHNSPWRNGWGNQEHHLLCSSTAGPHSAGQGVCVGKGKGWAEIWVLQMLIWCLTCRKVVTESAELYWICPAALYLVLQCYLDSPGDGDYSVPSRADLQEKYSRSVAKTWVSWKYNSSVAVEIFFFSPALTG